MKQKVLIIVENASVPADPRVWREAVTLSQNGYSVTVLSRRDSAGPRGYECLEGIHIYRHPMPIEGNSRFGHLYEYASALVWQFIFTFWIFIRRGFDLILGCNPPDTIFLIALPYKLFGVKYIFDHHDASPELYEAKFGKRGKIYKLLLFLEKQTFRFSDVTLATNNSYRSLAVARGGKRPDDVFVVRNGPDLETFRPVPPNPAQKNGKKFLVGYVGAMGNQDGLDILLDVALHIKNLGRHDVQFTMVGGGPELPRLREILKKYGLGDSVRFTGRIPQEELLEILSTADVCVNPDRPCEMNDISTMIKIMEYMALSKPIVQFQSKEGKFSAMEASLYADPKEEVKGFADKILWLLDHAEERKRMGDFGRKRIETELAWDYSVKNLLAAFDRALGKSPDSPSGKAHFPSSAETPSQGSVQSLPPHIDAATARANEANRAVVDFLRCPDDLLHIDAPEAVSCDPGFFNFGNDLICYGKCSAFTPSPSFGPDRHDAQKYASAKNGGVSLPFDLSGVVDALRTEKYLPSMSQNANDWWQWQIFRAGYYALRPLLSVAARKHLQRISLRGWRKRPFPQWPVDTTIERLLESVVTIFLRERPGESLPFVWFWPDGRQGCAVMTHDVETTPGRDFCETVMDVDDSFGVKASFQVVPESRYKVPESYLKSISDRGFEVNVQDLNHDGRLFQEMAEFERRSKIINQYAVAFNAKGFRAAVLYRNLEWLNRLSFDYDMSVPNVAHLDPQHGGCCTVFPYFIGDILEIPVTTTQDYSLFHILREYSLDLWKQQASRILERNGLMNFIIHPDYVTTKPEMRVFKDLLAYLAALREKAGVWTPLPREVSEWWRQRSRMQVVKNGGGWEIVGEGRERARLAFARLENGKLVYELKA